MTNDSAASGSDLELPETQLKLQLRGRLFVILEHDHPFLHWDFLIEDGDGLASWRLLELPESGKRVPALSLPVHRRHYLTWEGPVSGDRGTVRRIYSGKLKGDANSPDIACWPGHPFRMIDCGLAKNCQLIHDDSNLVHWEFS